MRVLELLSYLIYVSNILKIKMTFLYISRYIFRHTTTSFIQLTAYLITRLSIWTYIYGTMDNNTTIKRHLFLRYMLLTMIDYIVIREVY